MESNTEVKTPKLNKTNISSAFFGNEGGSASSIKNIHGTVSKLAGHVRKAVIRVGALEKNVSKIEEKLKKEPDDKEIKKEIKKEPDDKETKKESKNNFNSTLLETNKILVDIQKQLEQHFSNLAKEEKEKQQTLKKEKSKKRFGMEEGALESAKRIGSALVKTTSKILSPVKGFFDKILAFLGFLAAGFLTNAVFGWLSKEENQKKLTKFFNILKENWQLLAKIFGTLVIANLATKLVGALLTLKSIFAIFANPLFIAGIGVILAASMQGLGKQEKATIKDLEDMGGITPENRKKLIQKYKQEIENISYDTGGILGRVTLDPGKLDNLRHKIRFLETGRYDYGGKTLSFDFGLSNFNYNMGSKFNFDTGKLESLSGDGKSPGFDFGGERAMGGPVMAGRTYLVGEEGPELFSPNIDGSIVNNMRTEKIYNMISNNPKRNRKVNIQTMDLPPITVPMGGGSSTSSPSPAPSVPTISSRNILDSMRNETPGIYGIYV